MTTNYSLKYSFLFIFLIFAATCFSQEREIFVPENELSVLFEGATNRILIKRSEFETLIHKTRELQLETAEQTKYKPPTDAVLLSSDYRVEISELRAVIDGILEIDVLTDEPVSIPFPLERVTLLEAVFDGNQQPVAMSDNNGQKTLILSGKQRYRLRLRLTTPLEIDATRQRLNFRLIYSTETSFHLSVPGDVELKGGAAVLSRKVENDTTNFDLLLPPENNRTEILMSLNSHRKGKYRAILFRSVQFAEVTEQYERLHATVSLNELHQGVRETSFFVPAGFEITEVKSVFLDRWNVQKSMEKDKRDVLTIRFREQVPGLTTIYLSAIKSVQIDTQWSFPLLEPLDTAVHSAVLGLLLDEDLEMSHVENNNLFPIDTILLKDAIPPSALELLPGSPTLRLASAWYAPAKDELNKNVTAKFCRAESDFVIETVQNLILSETEPVLQYAAKITPRTGKIFETTLQIPENWNVLNVLDAAEQPLDFRFVPSENVSNNSEKTSENNFGKIIVRFAKGIPAGESVRFSLRAVGNVHNWFQNGAEKSFQYPVIRINGSANEQGNISIQNKFEDDWEIIPTQTEHLTPLKSLKRNLSFQYSSVPFTMSFRLDKLQPRLKSKTFSFYCFEPALFRIHYEIDCFIEQVSIRQLTLLLPASAPSTPSIQGLNGLNIKETLSEEIEINGQNFRRWKILFAEPMNEKVRIGVSFEQPIAEQTFTDTAIPFDLPSITVENTAWQSGVVAFEGDEELDLTIPTERNGKLVLRPIDTGELSVAEYRPGKRLLGVYSVTDPQNKITINVRKNQTTELLSALIRHVFITAKFDHTIATESNTGVLYSVLYEIQTAGGVVNIRTSLNKSDELWSITLDGEPIKAQRVGDDLLIPVSAKNNTDFRRLELLYWRPAFPVYVSKTLLIMDFPELSTNGKNGNEKIPVMQTTWNVIPPLGYEIVRLGDSVLQEPQPALFRLFQNTINFFHVLTSNSISLFNFEPVRMFERSVITLPQPYYQNNRTNKFDLELRRTQVANNTETLEINDNVDTQFQSGKGLINNFIVSNSITSAPEQTPESNETVSQLLPAQKISPQFTRRLQSIQPVSVIVSESDIADSAGSYSVIGNKNAQEISVQLSRVAVGQRWELIAFLVVVLVGLFGISQSHKRKTMFVFGLLILGTVLIFVPGLELFAAIFNGIVYGAVLTGAVYLVNTLRLKIVSIIIKPKISKPQISEPKISDMMVMLVLLFVFPCLSLHAEEQNEKLPKIQFPENVIIVPYSLDKISEGELPDPDKLTSQEQSLLVPYHQYTTNLELLKKYNEKIQKTQDIQNFVVPFTVSVAEYQTTLPVSGNDILLQGKIRIEVFTDETVFVPLTLENGVLVQPLLDNKPAILHSKNDRQTVLLVEGNGSHELMFSIRVCVQRQGGWRIATGKLPVAAASKISLILPDESGDLLTGNPFDKKKWSFGTNIADTNTTITKTYNKSIEISPAPNGVFHWQWRLAVSEENVDRNLEVDSVIRYDIQEGNVWLHWTPTFHISRGKWEMIRLCLPQDYLIAEIKGENVRGWNIVQENSEIRTIDVELLKPAEKIETLSILLSAPQHFVKPLTNLSFPKLSIPDAGIHRGRIDVFHSSVMNLRIQESTGLLPTDQVQQTESKSDLEFNTISPLGSSLFRSYRFASENYSLQIKWEQIPQNRTVKYFSVLKVTRQDIFLETKIVIDGQNKPFYTSIQLPEKFVLKNVHVPDGIFWNKKWSNDEKRLNIICADGRSQNVEILVTGDYSAAFSKERNEIESLPIFKTEKMKTDTTIAVLAEPSLDVRADISKDIRTKTPDSVFSWLSLPEQRELVRIVFFLEASSKNDGKLILSERKPEIRCSTITNVRTTAESIEETILLDFDITKAGVRNIEFVLPSWMNNAQIDVPFLRHKTITPLDTKNADSPVLVRLELHEEVMEQLRVLVRSDRRLQTETDYRVFVPIIRTGQTMRQYVVMENDRRSPDEMIVDHLQNLQALNRLQTEWSYLASILGANVTEAYFATKKESPVNNNSDDVANLSFRMKRRETVQLAEAQIGLAETRFTLGNNGDYRAEQIYCIDNKKEPYLDILLPEDASLWGARILTVTEWQQESMNNNIGLPVKPNMMPAEMAARYHKNATESRLIRIPLVKTESGDMDFIVRLIYAGELRKFSGWVRLEIPFIEVLNIPVGESLVQLNLPENYNYYFTGNLRRTEFETISQVYSNYQRQQTDRLRQVATGVNSFASKRAKINLQQLDVSGTFSGKNTFYGGTIVGGKVITDTPTLIGMGSVVLNNETYKSAESQTVAPDETKTSFTSNSATLSSNYYGQTNKFSGQLVQQTTLALDKTENQPATNHSSPSTFNSNWFTSNSLSNPSVTMENSNGGGFVDVNQKQNQSTVTKYNNKNQVPVSSHVSQVPQSVSQTDVPQQQNIVPQSQRSVEIVQGNIVLGKSETEANKTSSISQSDQNESPSEIPSDGIDSSFFSNKNSQYNGSGFFKNEYGRKSSTIDQSTESPVFSIDTKTFPLEPKQVTINNNSTAQLGYTFTFTDSTGAVQPENQQSTSPTTESIGVGGAISEQKSELYGSGSWDTNQQNDNVNYGSGGMVIASGTFDARESSVRGERKSGEISEKPQSELSVTSNIEQILPALSTQTSSLDIKIPHTGKTFVFTAPQGSLDLSVRTISARTSSRSVQMLLAVLGLVFLYGIYRLCFSIANRFTFNLRTHRNIAGLVTLFCVLSLLIAPLVSFLSFIFALILWIALFQRKTNNIIE
ncbi:MAG: hypothetical protein LBC20_06820 [Planctomycetaceae bacterium]|jgi:hypothetical protein|nr:hypothetical protein [Planctomycetaceae bacterium]